MKPVDMIDVPKKGDKASVGDCFRACIASIFETKVGEVPHFMMIDKRAKFHWTYSLDQWLAPQGLWFCDFPAAVKTWNVFVPLDGLYAIGSGYSPRFPASFHSVVVRLHRIDGLTIVHDPHPSRAGVVDDEFVNVGMFMSRRFTCPGGQDEDKC